MEILRECSVCGVQAFTRDDLEDFAKDSSMKYGRATLCKECDRARGAKYRAKNKDKIKDKQLQRNYNITLNDYNIMFKEQEGCCKICAGHTTEVGQLVVDHCHTKGDVRGLLCNRCNQALGLFKDNTDSLANAISYLNGEANEQI